MAKWSPSHIQFRNDLTDRLRKEKIYRKSPFKHRQDSISFEVLDAMAYAGDTLTLRVSRSVAMDAMVEIARYIGE